VKARVSHWCTSCARIVALWFDSTPRRVCSLALCSRVVRSRGGAYLNARRRLLDNSSHQLLNTTRLPCSVVARSACSGTHTRAEIKRHTYDPTSM
jgi:hypothetical protein